MPNNQQALLEYIKQTTGQANVLTVPRIYIKLTGSLEAALFLSQCIYWSDKGKRRDGSFYKSYREWHDELSLTRRDIDNARRACAAYVETELHRADGAPTIHYRLNLQKLVDAIAELVTAEQAAAQPDLPEMANGFVRNEQMDLYKTSKCLTETTHRIQHLTTAAEETARPSIFTTYEQNIGPLTPLIGERLADLEASVPATWPAEWFTVAATKAVSAGVRRLDYIEAIVKSWQRSGYNVDTRPAKVPQRGNGRRDRRDLLAELEAA